MNRVIPLAMLFPLLMALGCARSERQAPVSHADPGTVHVVARGLTFEAPDSIPSGWLTFDFDNQSPMTHLAVIERMPDGIGIAEQQAQVAPVFQDGMNFLAAGQTDSAMAAFGRLPEWFSKIVFTGGMGLTAPGHHSRSTVHLEPGTYLLECYVKTGGVFHSYNPDPNTYGMVHQLTVTNEPSGHPEPTPTIELTISSANGFQFDGDPAPGDNTVAVHFKDQKLHENFVGHDVHVARLADDTDLDALAKWMDWRRPGGLQTPAPVEFLGGLQEMPAGSTGYFTVHLTPGRYVWIAEVADPAKKNMLKTFTISGRGG